MFKTVDKDRFITLMALVVVLSALLGVWVDGRTSDNHANELSISTIWGGVEHGALGLTVFLFLFSKFLWKLSLTTWLGIAKYPNLAGKWEGTGKSDSFGTEFPVICTIKQDAWTINWDCEVQGESGRVTSRNKSIAVEFEREVRSLYLYVIYRNDINPYDPAKFGKDHYGACRLEITKSDRQQLTGAYWTNRKRDGQTCTSGKFHLEREERP